MRMMIWVAVAWAHPEKLRGWTWIWWEWARIWNERTSYLWSIFIIMIMRNVGKFLKRQIKQLKNLKNFYNPYEIWERWETAFENWGILKNVAGISGILKKLSILDWLKKIWEKLWKFMKVGANWGIRKKIWDSPADHVDALHPTLSLLEKVLRIVTIAIVIFTIIMIIKSVINHLRHHLQRHCLYPHHHQSHHDDHHLESERAFLVHLPLNKVKCETLVKKDCKNIYNKIDENARYHVQRS